MKKGIIIQASLTLLFVLAVLAGPSVAAPAKPIELKFTMWSTLQHSTSVEVYLPFAKEFEERTKGKAKIVFYPSEALGKAKDHYDMVARGIADMGIFIHGYTPGRFPLAGVMELPLGVPSAKVGSRVMWELYEKYMKQEYQGVKVLSMRTSEPGQIHMSKKQVKTLADIKGLRLRSPGPQQIPLLRSLGASPLNITVTEIYDALQKGMADGALLPFSAIKDFKLSDVLKHHTVANMYTMTSGIVMNQNTWNRLPADVQKVLEEMTGPKIVDKSADAVDRYAGLAREEAKKAGAEIYELPAAEKKVWAEKVKPIADAWVADMEKKHLPGKKVYQDAVTLVEKYKQ